MSIKIPKKPTRLLTFFILIPVLMLTLSALLQPQQIMQFAQEYSVPPLFGCLQVGEGNPTQCGTKLGKSTKEALTLYGRPLEQKQTVYYGDRVKGTLDFTNVGDLPINIKYIGIAAGQPIENFVVPFDPLKENVDLTTKQTISIPESSHLFRTQDPNGEWLVGVGITDTNKQILPTDEVATKITVNATCTALRVNELTNTDKSNIKALCAKDPKNILCTSKQYCEIFKGGSCPQPNVSKEIEYRQCDKFIVLDQQEQDILEQLCKSYPDSDACQDFCKRAINSKICPIVKVWVDKSGQQVFPQEPQYMAMNKSPEQAVAGASTSADSRVAFYIPGGGINGVLSTNPNSAPPPPAPPARAFPVVNPNPPQPKCGATCLPGQSNNPLNYRGYTPSCPSHRANYATPPECCASNYPLINNCCQPGCFVYSQVPLDRNNCHFKNKYGTCCSDTSVLNGGYCTGGENKTISPDIPGDPKIYPPQYVEQQNKLYQQQHQPAGNSQLPEKDQDPNAAPGGNGSTGITPPPPPAGPVNNCKCGPTQTCSDPVKGTCVALPANGCKVDNDCGPRFICQNNQCIPQGKPKGSQVSCEHNETIVPIGYQNQDPSLVQQRIDTIREGRRSACCYNACTSGSCAMTNGFTTCN